MTVNELILRLQASVRDGRGEREVRVFTNSRMEGARWYPIKTLRGGATNTPSLDIDLNEGITTDNLRV